MSRKNKGPQAVATRRLLLVGLAFCVVVTAAARGESGGPPAQLVQATGLIFADRDDAGVYASTKIIERSPELAYELGRNVFLHEWSATEGVHRIPSGDPLFGATTSCVLCHNLPFGTAGCGGNAPSGGGWGRNTPSLAGIGLIESIGFQIRAEILRANDTNHNGVLDVPTETAGKRAWVEAEPGVRLDFGSLDDNDGDGFPDLNSVLITRFVDAGGKPLFQMKPVDPVPTLNDARVRGYDIITGVFSASIGDHQFATLRQFSTGVFKTIFGIALPPNRGTPSEVTHAAGFGTTWSAPSTNGAPQEQLPPPSPASPGPSGLTRSELDLLEFFLLNQARPGMRRQTDETRRGQTLLRTMRCVECHVENWVLRPASADGTLGDRRTIEVDYTSDHADGSLMPYRVSRRAVSSAPVRIEGIYSDFRHHDLGPRFYEHVYKDGRVFSLRQFRTPPLWGGGSTAPYGHDGRSPTLDEVIRRHGGEAAEAAARYAASSADDQRAVLRFLQSLVLLGPEELELSDSETAENLRRKRLAACGVVPK